MNTNRPKAAKPDPEQRKSELREAITDADATGLVAGEELITEAETVLPLLRQTPEQPEAGQTGAALPHEDLHAALPYGHTAHATIDDLHHEIEGAAPNRQSIERHVAHLRSLPELEAIIANWWDTPATQRFVYNLTQIGL